MRVTFERPEDHVWGSILIERDDRVVYRMNAGPITAELPHDLVHYTVEDAMRVPDGIWGAIAGGVVFKSMTHQHGRRPPHAAERSAALIREFRDRIQHAELLGGFVEAAAEQPGADLAKLAAQWFATRPEDAPPVEAVRGAVAALHAVAERWRAIPVGGALSLDWPAHRKVRAARRS
jgi:aryl-alcohol dehydrogenase-like predicted oxidoreductase